MAGRLFNSISHILAEQFGGGTIIASVAEEEPVKIGDRVGTKTTIRAAYVTSFLDSMIRSQKEEADYVGSNAENTLSIKLYHINDLIRFLIEGDCGFFNFLYNDKTKQSEFAASHEYYIDPFMVFKLNKHIFLSQRFVQNTIEQAWSYFDDATESYTDQIDKHILISQAIGEISRLEHMQFDGEQWDLMFPYRQDIDHKRCIAIANGVVPYAESVEFLKKSIDKVEKSFAHNINIPETPDLKQIEASVQYFYKELLDQSHTLSQQ